MEVQSQNLGHGFGKGNLEKAQVVVLMVPFPAQSHLNQILQLACLISTYNIPVHYACFATHVRQVKLRFDGKNHDVGKLQFHEFPTPYFLSPPPNPNSETKFPSHLQPSFEASTQLRKPIATLLYEISPTARRIVVIHDVLMGNVVEDIASVPNAESYAFIPICTFTHFFKRWESGEVPFQVEVPKGLPSLEGCIPSEFNYFRALNYDPMKLASGLIYNSCRSIEGTYIDFMAKLQGAKNRKLWAIGPLNLQALDKTSLATKGQHKCLEWLDKQEPNSVLFVSFGTTCSMSSEQIKEIAVGLEESKQKFIWVLRDADRGDIFARDDRAVGLPEGYEERVKKFGMVVRDWVPQFEILGHPSTGGFMSHCGWNSCLESISTGVPVAAWPMHSDQPRNAFLITDILKIGLIMNKWEEREELLSSSVIAGVVKRLMASKEGVEIRKRAEELSGNVMESVKEGGASRVELDSFIAHITR